MHAPVRKALRHFQDYPEGDGRDAYGRRTVTTDGTAPVAGLHQDHREYNAAEPSGHPYRDVLARSHDGSTLGRRGHAEGKKALRGIAAPTGNSRSEGAALQAHQANLSFGNEVEPMPNSA